MCIPSGDFARHLGIRIVRPHGMQALSLVAGNFSGTANQSFCQRRAVRARVIGDLRQALGDAGKALSRRTGESERHCFGLERLQVVGRRA
jgi:hypothetical protein